MKNNNKRKQKNIRALDMPLFDTNAKANDLTGAFIADIVLQMHLYINKQEQLEPDDFERFPKPGANWLNCALNMKAFCPLPEITISRDVSKCHVVMIRFKSKSEKDTVIFIQYITVSNIPARDYEYEVNGKSAVVWVMARYQIKTDKASGIINDLHLYAEETGKPGYILDLLLSVIKAGVHTMDIVDGLREVEW